MIICYIKISLNIRIIPEREKMKKPITYAMYNLDNKIVENSSSGAIFYLLAQSVLNDEGVVYGVKMTEDFYGAEFERIAHINELYKILGSKYLQANIGDTYKCVKKDLIKGLTVLFSGTGCQINGLKLFLGREYYNLICVDVICHGVPSPTLWETYVKFQEKKYGGKVTNINFRCKDQYKFFPFFKKEKNLYIPNGEDPYMRMFIKNYSLRPSCYSCKAKNKKMSDITLGDFWGIENIVPSMDNKKGCSLVIVRTDKGEILIEKINKNTRYQEVSYEKSIQYNKSEFESSVFPSEREKFFRDMIKMNFKELRDTYLKDSLKIILKSFNRKIKYIFYFFMHLLIKKKDIFKMGNYGYLINFTIKR